MNAEASKQSDPSLFEAAAWYDRGINWEARLRREIPVLTGVFGPPGSGGLLDAGCGSGRQAVALARLGYRVTALDADSAMVELAARHARDAGVGIACVHAPYAELPEAAGRDFDGVYCLANALAATGERQACADAVGGFAAALRPGGKLFLQILNFRPMRDEHPCVRGPRVAIRDGCEYVSVRHFSFVARQCLVTNVTLWNDGGWRQRAHSGTLYPVDADEITQWCDQLHLRVEATYGSYGREPFDATRSADLILLATRLSK